ncbi:hypothetical protein COM71_02745 [Priestia megaterium]|nr:hypothetical protein COM71_02745 [Priestia megaterium]
MIHKFERDENNVGRFNFIVKKVAQEDYLPLLRSSLSTIKKLKVELEKKKSNTEPIAVIGMGCRFPGGCNDPETFWEFLNEGHDGVIEVPEDRGSIRDLYDPDPNATGKIYLKEAGFLQEKVSEFDSRFFGISPREAIEMDPQQRLLLEVSWEALERAGISANEIKGTQTGVFIGTIGSEYALLPRANKNTNPYTLTGSMSNIASGRISYILGVHGPSISIDTACSSSLVSVHLACESLQRGESSLALAGGVNLMLAPDGFLSLCELNALAKDGRCKTFDASGDGYGRGEGCGVVVLKRLSDALRDKDPVLAVIKGSGVNQDGPGSGLTVPNGKAQKELITKTLDVANVPPDDISYLEAHGTGTALGDPIEFQALTEVFGKDRKAENPLIIGSVKSNIGHLEAAAGMASLIKSILCLQNKTIPPNLHLDTVNPRIHLDKIPAKIPTESIPWETEGKQKNLGISSFGFSGTNAHVIMSEPPETLNTNNYMQSSFERPLHVLTLSAKDEDALSELIIKYKDYLDNKSLEKLENICFTANVGRTHFSHRTAFIAESSEQMKIILADYLRGNIKSGVIKSPNQDYKHPKLAFIINGEITRKSVRILYKTQPIFKENIQLCDEKFRQIANLSFLEGILSDEIATDANLYGVIDNIISFSFHYSLLKLWETWGIKPSVILGSQVGELVAACASEIMSMETALLYILENKGIKGRGDHRKLLKNPKIRIISGHTSRPIEKQQVISSTYWENIFDKDPNMEKGIQYLVEQGYKTFLQTGLIENLGYLKDIFAGSDIELYPSISEVNPWMSLTETLANLYCLGLNINWGGFDQNYDRRKVIVPTYPFQRKHFWCETASITDVFQASTEKNTNHMYIDNILDGKIINSPVKEKQIEYSLSLDTVPDIKDTHSVLHVGYFLEMLCRAIKNIYYTTSFHIQTIDFLTALVVPDSESVNISLTIDSKQDGALGFAFFSYQENNNWQKHAEGTIQLNKLNSIPLIDLGFKVDMISECIDQYSGIEFYRKLQKRGLYLGDSVQQIEHVWAREGEALAQFKFLPEQETGIKYEMGICPGAFDACAQLFHAALPNSIDKDMRYMVTKWEDFSFSNKWENQELWCHVILQDSTPKDNQLIGKFQLFDKNGTVMAQIQMGVMKGLNKERENAFKKHLEQSEEVSKEAEFNSEILSELKSSPMNQWKDILNQYLQIVFSSILGMETGELNISEPLMDIGMDSLVGVEAKTIVQKDLGIFLPIELLIVGPSIKELTESIIPLLPIKSYEVDSFKKDATAPSYKMDIHSWIVHRKSNPKAKMKLFCFPYGSGGGASLYRWWQAQLPDYIEVCPIQLPGKENRIKEKAFVDIDIATDVLKQVILPELDRPYAFYGHSIGAFFAYRLAYKLWKEIDNKPKHLFVGAYSSPTILPNPLVSFTRQKFREIGYEDIPGPEILSSIKSESLDRILGVITSELDINKELVRLLLPTRLSELQIVKDYNSIDKSIFNVPITAIHGKMDDKVSEQDMSDWSKLTSSAFKLCTLPGDHLFLREEQNQKQLLELLSKDLEKYK